MRLDDHGVILEPAKTPKQRQSDQEEGHEQEHEHINGHYDLRCLRC